MRIVESEEELSNAADWAKMHDMAAKHFGAAGARYFAEEYIQGGRHLEVQVFGDGAGRVIHMGERECSVQRRNQKV